MSQRISGYERKDRDLYETHEWVSESLIPHLPRTNAAFTTAWEPASGHGKMVRVLERHFSKVVATDVADNAAFDFLAYASVPDYAIRYIITNPPYEHATEFREHALELTRHVAGVVALLLRTDFDHAKSRVRLFAECQEFAKKVVLTKRIVWFEPPPGAVGKSPSFNDAWFIWDWRHEGPPTIGYAP